MARRRRYTVYFEDGSDPQVILTTDAMRAREYPWRRPIRTVQSGDYRREQAKAIERARADGRWEFDLPRIREAFEAMTGRALRPDVTFEKGRRTISQEGVFEVSLARRVVRVRRTLDIAAANEVLWHELAHVAQWARCGDTIEYIRQQKAEHRARLGYWNRPSEREAREWQCLAETDMLLKETP